MALFGWSEWSESYPGPLKLAATACLKKKILIQSTGLFYAIEVLNLPLLKRECQQCRMKDYQVEQHGFCLALPLVHERVRVSREEPQCSQFLYI